MITPADNTDEPTLVALLCSVLVHPGPVLLEIVEGGDISSMAALSFCDSGHPCSLVPVAAGPAVESD